MGEVSEPRVQAVPKAGAPEYDDIEGKFYLGAQLFSDAVRSVFFELNSPNVFRYVDDFSGKTRGKKKATLDPRAKAWICLLNAPDFLAIKNDYDSVNSVACGNGENKWISALNKYEPSCESLLQEIKTRQTKPN